MHILIISCSGYYQSPLETGCPPRWAYGWGSDRCGLFVDSKSYHFIWLNLDGTQLGVRSVWWCEVDELPTDPEEMREIGVEVASSPMADLIRTTASYRARRAVLQEEVNRKERNAREEAALLEDMRVHPEKYPSPEEMRRQNEAEQRLDHSEEE